MTGNARRGIVTVEAGGTEYRLRFTLNAMCEFEAGTGKPVAQAVGEFLGAAQMAMMSANTTRLLVKCMLSDQHPDMTLLAAGNLIDDLGGIAPTLGIIDRVLNAANPIANKGDTPEK